MYHVYMMQAELGKRWQFRNSVIIFNHLRHPLPHNDCAEPGLQRPVWRSIFIIIIIIIIPIIIIFIIPIIIITIIILIISNIIFIIFLPCRTGPAKACVEEQGRKAPLGGRPVRRLVTSPTTAGAQAQAQEPEQAQG